MKPEDASIVFATAVQDLQICVYVRHIMGWVGIVMFVRYTSPADGQVSFFLGSGGLVYAKAGGLCTDAVS